MFQVKGKIRLYEEIKLICGGITVYSKWLNINVVPSYTVNILLEFFFLYRPFSFAYS